MKDLVDPIGAFRPWPLRRMNSTAEGSWRREGELLNPDTTPGSNLSFLDLYQQACVHATELEKDELGRAYWSILGFAMGTWHSYGRQTLSVAPALIEGLSKTSLAKVPASILRAPYRALWIELTAALDDQQPLRGLFVLSGTVGEDPLYDSPDLRPTRPPETTTGTHALTLCGVTEHDALILTHLYLVKDTLEESLEHACQCYDSGLITSGGPLLMMAGLSRPRLQTLWGFVSNLFLYASSPNPDMQTVVPSGLERVPQSRKAWEIQDRIRRREGSVHALGYRLTKILRRPTSAEPARADSDLDPRHVRLHLVRGHWKHQVHGAGGSERKWIWVAPYGRGDDGTEEHLERVYVVE